MSRIACEPICLGCLTGGPCEIEQGDECGDCALEADHPPAPCEYGPNAGLGVNGIDEEDDS